ncbi:MAG: dimethyl sulfoxide reductase anchor subunit [Methylococcales bacterium]|jgi:sulfite dehydrogenase (quinone) subunit SoeC|nr:dimethyl sulfoxide reductase anchor subunit [Methylococcales bacterium]MBT7442767.1 dimethyl sulfoxide reductase anchor subunit [Methylococcales bacterium]
MHPAFSVILLTTLIGMGQGLFLALYTEQVYSSLQVLDASRDGQFYGIGSAIAVVLLIAGLLASFFHLGHPERAWRSAAMWRTSWLSREVILLPGFIFFVFLYGVTHLFGLDTTIMNIGAVAVTLSLVLGMIATALGFLLFVATGMIYACIRFLQEWHTPLTVINYLLLGTASGFTFATAYAAYYAPELVSFYAGWAIVLTSTALITRLSSLIRNKRLKPRSTLQSAIGVRHSGISQQAQGSMGGSFNTREFFHGKSDLFFKSIKYIFLVMVFLIPIILLAISFYQPSKMLLLSTITVQYIGLMAERWFFFAQANHPQNIYYQTIS